MGDVHILTGIEALINPENIRPGIDIKELEKKMISGGLMTTTAPEPKVKFLDEIQREAQRLGIDLDTSDKGISKAASYSAPSYSSSTPFDSSSSLPSILGSALSGSSSSSESPSESVESSGQFDTMNMSNSFNTGNLRDDSPYSSYSSKSSTYSSGSSLKSKTAEQERRAHIESVMGKSSGGFSFENEKREDAKCAMLAEIDSLMSTLLDQDVDLTRIPTVDRMSTFDEVESVLKMLRHKNDHNRYCDFAEEVLLFGAYGLEELFDGKRMWFGRYQPDLTGWHNHVNVKLKRMRHDTGQIVSEVMQDNNVGPGMRILFELVPNMVLYSSMRKQQHGDKGVFDGDMAAAAAAL